MLLYYTAPMKVENGQPENGNREKTWQATQYANIVRHVPSGIHYARLRIKGKLIWRSLKTDKISTAKAKLGDVGPLGPSTDQQVQQMLPIPYFHVVFPLAP